MANAARIDRAGLVAAARALAPQIAALRDEIEQERRTPPALVAAMRAAGFFRLWLPTELGGAEAEPETVLDIVETVASMDGSIAWNLLIGLSGGLFAGYLPEPEARAIWEPNPDAIIAGTFQPTGRAIAVEGGYQVSGRWNFASGVQHADWVCGNCLVFEGERPRMGADGAPEIRLMFFPASEATVLDTWHSGGMRGTGSHDFVMQGTFVPEGRWFDVFQGRGRIDRPLYRQTFLTWFSPGVAALMLGIARHAISALVELAATKVPAGGREALRERPLAQIQVAQAEAIVLSARSFLFQATREAWAALVRDSESAETERTRLLLASVHATACATQAVDLMYKAAGSSAIASASVLDRCMRDTHGAGQHIAVNGQHYQTIGQALFTETAASTP